MSIRIFNQDLPLPSLVLMAVEAAISVAMLFLVASVWSEAVPGWRTTVLFSGLFVLSSGALGLYNLRLRTRMLGLAMRYGLAGSFAFVLIWIGLSAFPSSRISLWEYAGALAFACATAFLTRCCLNVVAADGFLKSRVLVLGVGEKARAFTQLRRRTDRLCFSLVGYVRGNGESPVVPEYQILEAQGSLLGLCQRLHVDEIVVALDDNRRSFPSRELLLCRVNGIHVVDLVAFLERETGALRLDLLKPSWMIFAPGFNHSAVHEALGRVFDIVVSLMLMAATWPLMLLAAVAIKLEDGVSAPVLYRQRRVGKNGRVFTVFKFRSMNTGAEADGVARWACERDSRVTRVGAVMRPIRVDELPQLWNVLRGDMRFVGPRPERPEFVSDFDRNLPYYQQRHTVRPGLTGWAQLRYNYGASEQDAVEKLKYDLYYVKNHSLVFDLVILIQTVEVILFGRGAR